MEIRNQLTLELITTLHPTETIPHLKGPLAYSPDGRSIACVSDTAIIIWDVQTGGVAKEIKCSANSVSLVWSSDGRMICTINLGGWGDFIVHKYDTSGTTLSSHTLLSRDIPHLWTDEESFRVLTTLWGKYPNGHTIDIFKVGSTSLTKIRSFTLPRTNGAVVGSFSQTTHRISISDGDSIRILDMQSSECLLNEPLQLSSHCFSSDGSRFAAYGQIEIYVWEYGSGRYVLLGEFQCHHVSISPLRFSPTPSSILGRANGILQVWRLHELPTSSTRRRQYAGLSRSWTRIATAHELENTITIVDLLVQNPPQFIDTNVKIEGLVVTGNVLLVAGSGQLVAWLLTEDGLVDGVIGDRRADRSNSIWAISKSTRTPQWQFQVVSQVGFIMLPGNAPHIYHTETGEVLHLTQVTRDFRGLKDALGYPHLGREYLRFHNLSQCDTPLGDSWKTSQATLREGWVKDAEGKHRLWVPAEWRTEWNLADWRHDVTTQFSYLGGRIAVIKF